MQTDAVACARTNPCIFGEEKKRSNTHTHLQGQVEDGMNEEMDGDNSGGDRAKPVVWMLACMECSTKQRK